MAFDLVHIGEGKDPWGGYRSGFNATTTIKRSDFGVNYMVPNIPDEMSINLFVEGVRSNGRGTPAANPGGSFGSRFVVVALAAAGVSVGRPGALVGGLPAGRCLRAAGQSVAVAAADPAGARPGGAAGRPAGRACAVCRSGALVWWQGLASVLASEPAIWLALLPAIAWLGWTGLRGDSREGLGFALGFIWLALVIGIDGSLLIAQLAGALAAFAGFRALLGAFAGSQVAPAALGLALAFVQMLAWQYVEVPLLVLLPVWLLPLLEWALRSKPWIQLWAMLILLAGAGAGLSLWKVWPEASLY